MDKEEISKILLRWNQVSPSVTAMVLFLLVGYFENIKAWFKRIRRAS